MKRINVTFFEETFEKLETRMKRNGTKSIAHGIRELVDLGLKIEEAARKNEDEPNEDAFGLLTNMLKNNLIWSLEVRLLMRHIVEAMSEDPKPIERNMLQRCRVSASDYVKGMLGEVVE